MHASSPREARPVTCAGAARCRSRCTDPPRCTISVCSEVVAVVVRFLFSVCPYRFYAELSLRAVPGAALESLARTGVLGLLESAGLQALSCCTIGAALG
ncbi:hypothetical protein NDU88_002991 [Pleurodeles waltl]|uniref:Uncharacterized protein n=1 Tax=Pleurodeles waltl TaxID=8319 RepID=A0AAV7TM73_PLEWA|nr:hypothetical protein NDU88_002991 [Pleurodeles waltl]